MRFHTNLPVKDIARTVAFYRVLFGTEPVKTRSDYAKFLPSDLALNLSFHQDPAAVNSLRSLHLGLELPDQLTLDQAHRRLLDAGLVSTRRQVSICCYARQDKFWVTDPSGYQWELYRVLEDTTTKISADTACCANGAVEADGCC